MKARHKDTGEIIELAEQGIISHDGRGFCWYQVELIPEPIDEVKPSLPSDLAELTWEDIRQLFKIADNYDSEFDRDSYLSKGYCKEVLRRFLENKSK